MEDNTIKDELRLHGITGKIIEVTDGHVIVAESTDDGHVSVVAYCLCCWRRMARVVHECLDAALESLKAMLVETCVRCKRTAGGFHPISHLPASMSSGQVGHLDGPARMSW